MPKYQIVLFTGVNTIYSGRPIAIYRLASHLRTHGYTVKTINGFDRMSSDVFQKTIDLYISDETVLVGISATVLFDHGNQWWFGVTDQEFDVRAGQLRDKNSKIKIIGGGGQFNNANTQIFNSFADTLDYISIGQGENTILAVANHLTQNARLVTTTVQRPQVVTDKTYPFTEFNSSLDTFTIDDDILPGESLPLELARGCIFKCKFCSYDLTNKRLTDYTKSEHVLQQELLHNYTHYQTQSYYIVDDLINDSLEKVEMLEKVILGLPFKIVFSGYLRLDLLRRYPQMIEKLKNIGLVSCFFGIETIHDPSGQAVGKGLGLKRTNEALKKCAEIWNNDVHVQANFILGLPHDSVTTTQELLKWSHQAIDQGWLHKITYSHLSINPGVGKAEIDQNPEKFGYKLLPANTVLYSNVAKNPRYIGQEMAWKLNNYSRDQAYDDAVQMQSELQAREPLPMMSAFSAGFVIYLTGLSSAQVLNLATNQITYTKDSAGLSNNFQQLLYKKYQKYLNSYFDKLLKIS